MKQDFKERQLISQFMGGEADTHVLVPFEYWSGQEFPFSGNNFNKDEDAEDEVREELQEYTTHWHIEVQSYHNSWDMLIPVVEKCFNVLDGEEDNFCHKLNDAVLTLNISEVYRTVLDCIEHLNPQR